MKRRGFGHWGFGLCTLVLAILFVGLAVLGVPVSTLLTGALVTSWVLMLVFVTADRRPRRDASDQTDNRDNRFTAGRHDEPKVGEQTLA